MPSFFGEAAAIGGIATVVAATLWHRHHFSTVTQPRRRFVQNYIIEETIELYERDILSSATQRMKCLHDVKATAVLDKFPLFDALEGLGFAIAMDVDKDLMVRFVHVLKYVLFLRVHDALAAPVDRPRSYMPFESILTYRSREWMELALALEKYLAMDFLCNIISHEGERPVFSDKSISFVGNESERAYIEQIFREETLPGLKAMNTKHNKIARSMCWDLLFRGKIAGRNREKSRNRKIQFLSTGLIALEIAKMALMAKMDVLSIVAAPSSSSDLGGRLKLFISLSFLKILREPLETRARRSLKALLMQEQQYIYAVSIAGIDQAFRDQAGFEKYCSMNDAERTARRASHQLLDFIRLTGASLYVAGLFAVSLWRKEVPLFSIGFLGGALLTYENLTAFWNRFALGTNSVVDKCKLDFSMVDERPLPPQKPLLGLRLMGNVLASNHTARFQSHPASHLHLSVVILASVHEKHDIMGDLGLWRAWGSDVCIALEKTAFSVLPATLVQNVKFIVNNVVGSWTDISAVSSQTSARELDAQYLDRDECQMLRRSANYISTAETQEMFVDTPRFALLRSLGVEVLHVFRCVREKRIMYESKLRKETMESATDPSKGGFSVLLEEACHVGLMLMLHVSVCSNWLRRDLDSIGALAQLKSYSSAFSHLSYRWDCTFHRLIEMYELQHDAPSSIASAAPDGAIDLAAWRQRLSLLRPELVYDVHNRICGGFRLQDAIRFEAVSFSYPSTVATKTFDRLSFTIPAHSFTGIMGKTGSGKSTVLKLIKRLYDPLLIGNGHIDGSPGDAGTITFDGIPAKCFALSYLRSLVATVDQKPTVFRDLTIMDNIAFFRPVTKDDVIAASKRAQCHNFIMALPMQYDTVVSREFSGGEMQRIAIARALVVSPTVLFLDEATSSLDAVNENRVQEAIDALADSKGTTIVAIAHRLSTLKKANHFVVLMDGKCVQEGSHEKLLAMSDEEALNGRNVYRSYLQGQSLATRHAGQSNRRRKVPQKVLESLTSMLRSGELRAELLAQCLKDGQSDHSAGDARGEPSEMSPDESETDADETTENMCPCKVDED